METIESSLGKSVFARLSEDEDLLDSITLVARRSLINAGFFIVIGTLKGAKVGFYRERKYEIITINAPLEIVSCVGNISLKDNAPFTHAHISISNEKGEVLGGHLMPGCRIGATAEMVLIEVKDARLLRKVDDKTGLSLLTLNK